ncbi:hypothetical protein EMWEY_00014980 [Eimeria maxima]|uniref:Uncharacterized protein n=1 Tax=Eimeria maxima TaxID=5804 RepID=U6M5G8_EIMMA|nr:hypothetical protein EMWEY_00014980 [Eimeria maxima]CDJ58308.1 hypothetical protein EMWEY_00014980 [Eimeria maxima]
MPDLPNIFEIRVNQGGPSASASSEPPTVGSGLAPPGNSSPRAFRSPPPGVVFATIASVVAVVVLVFLCSRVYQRSALHGRRSRKLASSKDDDAHVDTCGDSGDDEKERQQEIPQSPRSPGLEALNLPLKKRLLLRVAETGTGGSGLNPRQQRQQLLLHEQGGAAPGFSPPRVVTRQEELESLGHAVPSALSSAQQGVPEGSMLLQLLSNPTDQRAAGNRGSRAREAGSVDEQKLQTRLQGEQGRGCWQSRQQQLQERKRKQRQELELLEEEPKKRERTLQPAELLGAEIEEDSWIAPESPSTETSQRGSSQQTLQSSTTPASTSLSTPSHFRENVVPGSSVIFFAAPHADTTVVSSSDEAAAAPAAGAAAASTGAAVERPFPSSAAWTPSGGGMSLEMPVTASKMVGGRIVDEGTAAVEEAAGSARGTSLSHPNLIQQLGAPGDAFPSARDHPLVRLPKPVVSKTPHGIAINFQRALSNRSTMREVVPLLLRAHKLLSREFLYAGHMVDLALAAEALIEYGMQYQSQSLASFQLFYTLEKLAIRFVVLDCVVSTLVVLDQTPDPRLWKRFADAIKDDATLISSDVEMPLGRPNVNVGRAQQLIRAIQVFKTGRRPDPEELLQIKKWLFCSPTSPRRFRKKEFDPWRKGCLPPTDKQ